MLIDFLMSKMAAPKKTFNQQDLRRLMKERKVPTKKVDSPLAKYNNLGQLTCVVCNVRIKDESVWSAHIVSRVHKEHIEALKRKKAATTKSTISSAPAYRAEKRKLDNLGLAASEVKRHATDSRRSTASGRQDTSQAQTKKPPSSNILAHYYSSEDEEEEEDKEKGKDASKTVEENSHSASSRSDDASSALPADFFDTPGVSGDTEPSKSLTTDEQMDTEETDSPQTTIADAVSLKVNSAEALPEGFFDDPILDAKVRKVEYKDPIEEEWEKFQKAIAEENTVSQAIIDEDLEVSKVEREISEIDEQIHNWARVEALLKKKEQLRQTDQSQMDDSDAHASADEQEFEEFLDWRAKGVLKK